MSTKLYFHDVAADDSLGQLPTGTQSSIAPATQTATGANTVRQMNENRGVAQTSIGLASTATLSNQRSFYRMFVSPPLEGAQNLGGALNERLNVADAESNLNMNHWIDCYVVYIWRPSTGTVVGYLVDTANFGGTEPSSASSEQVTTLAATLTGVATQDGDVIICEIWADFTQGMAVSYTGTFYYDGTTENATENAVVSNHASHFELVEGAVFKMPQFQPISQPDRSPTVMVGY